MKKLVNPTTYFFKEADQVSSEPTPQIQDFVKTLLNKDQCQLCRLPYDIQERIPRILIHCGHTFCTPCLSQFYMPSKIRVRCPMCLKLIKQLDTLQRLPINHTIFTHLVQKEKQRCLSIKKQPKTMDASKFLYSQFERVQKEAHKNDRPQKYDEQSGLPFCVFHSDRVQHFYCESHKIFGCRVCIEIGHSKNDCNVVDLYTVDNPLRYQNIMEARIQENYVPQIPSIPQFQNYQNNRLYGLGEIDPRLLDDDDSQQAHRSV